MMRMQVGENLKIDSGMAGVNEIRDEEKATAMKTTEQVVTLKNNTDRIIAEICGSEIFTQPGKKDWRKPFDRFKEIAKGDEGGFFQEYAHELGMAALVVTVILVFIGLSTGTFTDLWNTVWDWLQSKFGIS